MQINKIYNGDCLEVLKTFPDNSIDSCVTDPPYGISFMNKHWDYQIPSVEIWAEVFRVLKPGGHVFCACGTRTQHRMTVNIEDAGFEIRDVITWHYGSGFPKSLDISKAIDKASGAEPGEIIGYQKATGNARGKGAAGHYANSLTGVAGYDVVKKGWDITAPSTDAAKEWEGWGTALKPATEFWTLARKPIEENTIAENVLKYGTGGLNIDGSRIATDEVLNIGSNNRENGSINFGMKDNKEAQEQNSLGRFPANVIFDEFTGKLLDEQSGFSESSSSTNRIGNNSQGNGGFVLADRVNGILTGHDDQGGASRFFYCPKADNYERNKGLKGFEEKSKPSGGHGNTENDPISIAMGSLRKSSNHHPTVKPIDLMRYLVKLITPKRGICIDPFCGSGTTLIGCKLELINYIGIDLNEEYCKIAEARVAAWNPEKYIEQTLF